MAFTIIDASGPVISAKISGELGKSEVSQIQAAALDAIRRCGKISALFILDNFHGWKREPDWGDVTFLTEHDKDIAKIAVVGEERVAGSCLRLSRQRLSPSRSRIFPSWRSGKSARLARHGCCIVIM